MYCKGKWCTADGKDPLFGRVDGFQIDPKICYRFFPQGKDMCDMLLLLKKRRFVQKVGMV